MKKGWGVLLLLILVIGLVYAAGDWDSFDNDSEGEPVLYEEPNNVDIPADNSDSEYIDDVKSEVISTRYTENFYYALAAIGVFILILLIVAYFFFRGPKEKWKVPVKKVPEPLS